MRQIQLRIFASFGVAILVIVTGWIGASAISSAMSQRIRLKRARNTIDTAQQLARQLLDAETGQRGYLLTHDRSYLDPYEAAMTAPDPLKRLAELTRDDPDEVGLVASLTTHVGDKRAELATALHLAETGDVDGAVAHVREGTGRHTMDLVRADLEAIVQREGVALDPSRERFTQTLQIARVVVLVGTLLTFVLAVLVNLSLMRALRERELVQATVEKQSAMLREQTDSLLAHETQLAEQLVRQQELSAALKKSNDELDQFAYATSHDLKAPLRGILNLAAWIEEDVGEKASADVKQHLATLQNRARRLEMLIDGALAYARAGRQRGAIEVIDIKALVDEIVELVAAPGTCTISASGTFPKLATERAPLQQVLLNLVQNAVKHGCPDGKGRVDVSAEETDGLWHFVVRDQGPGIDASYHSRIFGIFQTLQPRDQVESTGIGLAVVKKIVETRGGVIVLSSEPGRGARFDFSWPVEA